MSYHSKFDLWDRVLIDGNKSPVGIVTAIQMRSESAVLIEVSYMHDGNAKTAWIEEERLEYEEKIVVPVSEPVRKFVYCYRPHAQVIERLFAGLGLNLRPVSDEMSLRDYRGHGTAPTTEAVIILRDHYEKIPLALDLAISQSGLRRIVITGGQEYLS